jgi:hypothetical protein
MPTPSQAYRRPTKEGGGISKKKKVRRKGDG